MRCRSVRLVDLAARDLAGEPAPVEDEDAVAEADQLRQFGRAEEHDAAVRRHLADQAVDLALGADVDAAGRIVEQEDLGPDLQPLADDDLLLVAAGELVGEAERPSAS